MKMTASSLTVICLALFLLHLQFSEGRGKGKASRPSSSGSSSSSKSSSSSSSSSGSSSNKGNSNKPSQTNHGYGHPQPGWHGNTNPSRNSPNQRGHGTHGGYGGHQGGYGGNQGGYGGNQGGYGGHQGGYGGHQGGYGGHQGGYGGHQGGYGAGHGTGYGGYSYGGYQGGYINRNPANRIASPYYGDGASYGGYNARGGSPFSRSVQSLGRGPTDKSRGFGRKAALAAAGGAAGGMAMGYGLGRMHRPDFPMNSPQEEYYYNHYVHKKHGTKTVKTEGDRANKGSSDNNVNEDYTTSNHGAPMTYNDYMEKCMIDLERDQVKIMEQSNKSTVATTSTTTRATRSVTTSAVSANAAGSNKTALNESTPSPSVSPDLSKTPNDEKTVSIVEIGYPALIYQHNVKTCMERFLAYSEFIKGGAQGMATGSQGLVALAIGVMVMSLNSNLLVSLFSG